MNGDGWLLTKDERQEWLDALLRDGKRLIAPVDDEGLTLFRAVSTAAEASLEDYGNARWSPKEHQFPNTEALFSYSFQGDDVLLEDTPPDDQEQVLFGVRPCDAAGLTRLDDIFLGDQTDPFYARRKEATTTISMACDKSRPECFCTAVGGSPGGTEGSDIQLVPLPGEEVSLLRTMTPKGDELVAGHSDSWKPAGPEDLAKSEDLRVAVEQQIEHAPLVPEWSAALEGTFDHPLWEAVGERCLGCGICAYVCPSCSCFDVTDQGNAYCGTRCRSWDSCTFAQFTLHASGHNPRPDQPARYRQRVMHKFAYFPLEHDDRSMCVGCGRCVALCPVGIDIHQSVRTAVSAGASGEGSS